MKKKNQKWFCGIAVLLSLVVATTTVLHSWELAYARETFSGLQTMLDNRQLLSIVEVVDDFDESSMGYLFGGLEPYDLETEKREGTLGILLDDLLSRGLITMGDTDNWSAYPLRYEILDTKYSDYADGQRDLELDYEYRLKNEGSIDMDGNGTGEYQVEPTEFNGYYVELTEKDIEEDGVAAFYRCSDEDYEKMAKADESDLPDLVKECITASYAPDNVNESEKKEDGSYQYRPGYHFFKFFVDLRDAEEFLAERDDSDDEENGSGDTTLSIEETMEDAVPTPLEEEETVPSSDESDITTTPEQSDADGEAPVEQTEESSEAPSEAEQAEESNNSSTVAEQSGDNSEASTGDAGQTNNADSPQQSTEQSNDNNEPSNSDSESSESASAIIYVEFDESHSVLVASYGNAGVADVLDSSLNSDDDKTVTETPQSTVAPGSINGINVTVTPIPTPDQGVAPAPAPTQGGESDSDKSGASTSNAGNTSDGNENTGSESNENTDGGSTEEDADTGNGGQEGNENAGDGSENVGGDDVDKDAEGDEEDSEDGDTESDGDEDDGDTESDGDEEEDGDEDGVYTVRYQWEGLDPEKGTFTTPELPGDVEIKNGEEIPFPDDPDDIEVTDSEGVTIGTYKFSGWKVSEADSDSDTDDDADDAGDSITIVTVIGTWSYCESGYYLITYQWRLAGENGSLPDGVTADNIVLKSPFQTFGMDEQSVVDLPENESVPMGSSYTLHDDYEGAYFDVYDVDGNYIGIAMCEGLESGNGEALEGEITPDGDMTVYVRLMITLDDPVDDEETSDVEFPLAGTGYAYEFVNETIKNNNWFRYYVMGLEENNYGWVNVQLVVYLADGSDYKLYGYSDDGAAKAPTSLADAIGRADLVYLNTDGLDSKGDSVSGLKTEAAKALLERACAVDRSDRMAVILDNSVQDNRIDENVWKVRTILLQDDIAEAYASLSEGGMSYEKAFESDEWQQLYFSMMTRPNSGNFVHDNIYCVAYVNRQFNNPTYSLTDSEVNFDSMFALANADFAKRFTNDATDEGFAEVYQAIQRDNYERARSDTSQGSLDEYVMPATAVAYVLNYRYYNPIIYKDKIRVLELEPCRDYTYYYDCAHDECGASCTAHEAGTTALELKKKFAAKYAYNFLAKLDDDPDAITIDGMTTSEFCGKILDVYEEYDVIYFGSNSGILEHASVEAGSQWVKKDAYDGTIDSFTISWSNQSYTYFDGKWYTMKPTGEVNQPRSEGPNSDVDISWNGGWKWNGAKKQWYQDGTPSSSGPGFWYECTTDGNTYYWDYRIQHWRIKEVVYAVSGESSGPGAVWSDMNSIDASKWVWIPNDWYSNDFPSKGWYHKDAIIGGTYTKYGDADMNGMLYTHVGDMMTHANGNYMGYLVNEYAGDYRSSGNDILATQVDELLDYLSGGSLVILSGDFITTDANGKWAINSSNIVTNAGSTSSFCGILDTSSYVYQFVKACFNETGDGVMPKYSNLIVDKEGYGNGDLNVEEACVEALNQQKVTLNLYDMPTPYDYVECSVSGTSYQTLNWNNQIVTEYKSYANEVTRIDEDTRHLLQEEDDGIYYLNYEFIIGNLSAVAPYSTRYHVQLFLDSNSDGIYNTATEELTDITVINAQTGEIVGRDGAGRYQLQANVPYRVRRELPDGYVGCIGWKLTVTQNGNEHIHDSATGLTATKVNPDANTNEVNPITHKKVIHVLQISPVQYGGNKMDLEYHTDAANIQKWNLDYEWYELLTNLPDFEIDFDTIYYMDFAKSFLQPGQTHYEAAYDNGGVDGKLTGKKDGSFREGDDAYLNLYQYDMVIVGFQDNSNAIPSQKAVEALLRYADMGKSMLFTHDCTYSVWGYSADPSDFTYSGGLQQSLTMSIRELCGMDRYGVSVDWYGYDENGTANNSNKAASPVRNTAASEVVYDSNSSVYQWWEDHDGNHSRDIAYAPGTNQTMMAAQTQGFTWSITDDVFRYAFNWSSRSSLTSGQIKKLDMPNMNTNTEVTQVNSGIITQYPYDIDPAIRVGNTHAQYFQLDLDTDRDGDGRGDVVCWYAISSLDPGDWNDLYDYAPNDVRNNYYIYNKGNITYTGVGHSTENLTMDEKKLFINTFVAAYNAGIRNPSVRIVDSGSVNAADLEYMSIPFDNNSVVPDLGSENVINKDTEGTVRVYYQVKDNNITQGTRSLRVKYYLGNESSSNTVNQTEIHADLFADGKLTTYSAETNQEVGFDEVLSGKSYYVYVPLNMLVGNESFDFYVEVDLMMVSDDGSVKAAASDYDKLTIMKLNLFSLD